MPNLPSSFASAVAGQNSSRGGARADGRGGQGDASRRDGRSTNGTLTFRRSSTTPLSQSAQAPASDLPPQNPLADPNNSGAQDIPGQGQGVSGSPVYTKDYLFAKLKEPPSSTESDMTRLHLSGWAGHAQVNGHAAKAWGRGSEPQAPQDSDPCWNSRGNSRPIAFRDLSSEEQEVFASDINSTVKPPQHAKDSTHQPGMNGRKTSFSHGTASGYGVTSPTSATRPSTRRRDTNESSPFSGGGLVSPTGTGRFSREDGSHSWFSRKSLEVKESEGEEAEEEAPATLAESQTPRGGPFGSLLRTNTSGSTGLGSLWPASGPVTSPGANAFGNFSFGSSAPADKGFGSTRGSRLAHLIPKESSENIGARSNEPQNPDLSRPWRTRPRTDTDPFGDDGVSGGSPHSLGMTSTSHSAAAADLYSTPAKSTGDFASGRLASGLHAEHDRGPTSPSETNPYRSPPTDRADAGDQEDHNLEKPYGSAAPSNEQASAFNTMSRGFSGNAFEGSDRSQTSSAGPRGYGGLPSLTGWPAPTGPPSGTPDRDRPGYGGAFGSTLFSPMGTEIQSPGLSVLGGVFGGAGTIGTGSGRGTSRLGNLFPASMQAQMQEHDPLSDSIPELRQANPLGAIGRTPFGREGDLSSRAAVGGFDDAHNPPDMALGHGIYGPTDASQAQSFGALATTGPPFSAQADASAAQVRQMVMPDRMRWIYLDPEGKIRGPFTGLEMHDWYKAHFFTPDLPVRKVEDPEFEPLGQLIRRIGNSREPFLVPQIGIPHGPPPTGQFTPAGASGIVPPLSQVMPAFGRTLTAEEQNNLERRKQEEQILMAQQRELMVRTQGISNFPIGGPTGSGALHHHASVHSLQSQPSFGSIKSPVGMPPIGAITTPAGYFDQTTGPQGPAGAPKGTTSTAPDQFRDEDLANMSISERQPFTSSHQASAAPAPFATHSFGAAPVATLRSQLPGSDQLQEDSEGFRDRLLHFERLRGELEQEEVGQELDHDASFDEDEIVAAAASALETRQFAKGAATSASREKGPAADETTSLSLTQQVQHAQAHAEAAAKATAAGLPLPFPPPQSGTPLPAPMAQRARSNLPEQYSRSRSETPEVPPSATSQAPPLAPWAREPGVEAHKGPSLKEIQAAESLQAAKQEAAAAARRVQLEQEAALLREREKAAATATGLATTSTWGNGSPVNPTSPWTKPTVAKPAAPGQGGPVAPPLERRKTLAEIQREEEARKQKQKEIAVQSGVAPPTGGKRYADLASKGGGAGASQQAALAAAAAGATPGSGWATVGAGGKVKGASQATQQPRAVSTGAAKPAAASKPAVKQIASSANVATSRVPGSEAQQEFRAWLIRELGRGLNDNVNIEGFVSTLMELPAEAGLIAEAVYAYSKTMNGNHFAEEFIRRKRLADKGVVERQAAPTVPETNKTSSSGGWNEVAKKGGHKETGPGQTQGGEVSIPGVGFKVVSGRKKGRK